MRNLGVAFGAQTKAKMQCYLRPLPREARYHIMSHDAVTRTTSPCSIGRDLTSPEFEIECKPDQYLEVAVGYGTRMIRLETWWATVGEETTYEWNFEVVNAAESYVYYFDYGQFGGDPYGTTLQGGAGAAVIATITAGDAAGNTDSCSFLMELWPQGSGLRNDREIISVYCPVLPGVTRIGRPK